MERWPLTARALLSAVIASSLLACSSPSRGAANDTSSVAGSSGVDSIVLERSLCFGTCPAYRLRLTGRGLVTFESRNPGDSGRTATDSIAPERVSALERTAAENGFFDLPTAIADDPKLCPARATDHPWTHVAMYGSRTKVVDDYQGCYAATDGPRSVVPAVEKLRAFEAAIDSVAGSARWVRPADRR